MSALPQAVQKLVNALERLPGVGPKSAWRLTFFLLRSQDDLTNDLAEALQGLHANTTLCPMCFNITQTGEEQCELCRDPRRDAAVLCVVEEPMDVIVLEQTGGFSGRYHVLHGVMSPIEGVMAEDLKIAPLVERVKAGGIKEVIIATNPSSEGDVTALHLRKLLLPLGVRITRLARGLPVGGDLEYADPSTLLRALAGRQEMD